MDVYGDCALLPETEMVRLGGLLIYMLHSVKDLDLNPQAAGVGLVISGHSHVPTVEMRGGVCYLNPGSAGPRRFQLPITVARVEIADDGSFTAKVLPLQL